MAKLDKTNLSKTQIKILLQEKRNKKLAKTHQKNLKDKGPFANNILVLKHGKKYGPEYVNKMYKMVSKHCTLPFNFYCLTENSDGLEKEINVIPLPIMNVEGWWYKPYIYSKDLPIEGTILYIDLDMVIVDNIDKFFTYEPNRYCVLRDFTRAMRPKWEKYNSSLVRFKKGQLDDVWEEFKRNPDVITRRLFGDQDYLFEKTRGQAILWPDSWCLSWKWEIRQNKMFKAGGTKGNRVFDKIEHCEAPPACSIIAFHGDPNPHRCEDPFIIDNWHKI